MTLEALIFDLDGTLADTEEAHRQAFNAAFISLGLWWDWGPRLYGELLEISSGADRLHHYIEHRLKAAPAERARLRASVPAIHATKSELYRELLRAGKPPLRPGVERLVGEARKQGLTIAVVSTTTSANALELLGNHFKPAGGGVELLVCADEVPRRKPAPDLYRRALSLLRKPAGACLVFEDSANGLRAALAAGLATVATPSRWTMMQDFAGADALLPDLHDLSLDQARRIHQSARRRRDIAAA